MAMIRIRILGLSAAVVLAFVLGCAGAQSNFDGTDRSLTLLDPALCSATGDFTLESTNPYFPMDVGKQWVLEGENERVEVTVLDETEVVSGVTTRVIEEREFKNGKVKEVSRNYFAQASDGTVCYFGEAVDPHEGVWRADDPGSEPGIIMPADPRPGMAFKMEIAPGKAEDEVEIVEFKTTEVPAGTFTGTIRVRELDPLKNDSDYKVFARGVGIIIDEDLELVEVVAP
jgi:hypothetical protein